MDTPQTQRPLFITMFCSFYFVYWAISIISLIVFLLINVGAQFPGISWILNRINLIFIGTQVNISWITWLIAAGLVAGIVGYWFLQKWAVIVYTASSIALAVIALPAVLPTMVSTPSKIFYAAVVLSAIVSIFAINIGMIVVGIVYFKKMK